jgi:RNA polymerase sigma factor (sigma-70 family)
VTLDLEPPDAVLASRAAKGDQRAFALLVERYKAPIYRLLYRYLSDADEAHEAAHEAFIAAWAALDRYDPNRPFGAWLRTIAINKARDRGRRRAFRRMLFGSNARNNAEVETKADPSATPEESLAEQDALRSLERKIADLPGHLKEALILTALEGYSHKAAGDILRVSPKTVETRVYRARRALLLQMSTMERSPFTDQ